MTVYVPPNVVVVMKLILAGAELCSIEGTAAVCMRLRKPWNELHCTNVHATHTKKVIKCPKQPLYSI